VFIGAKQRLSDLGGVINTDGSL